MSSIRPIQSIPTNLIATKRMVAQDATAFDLSALFWYSSIVPVTVIQDFATLDVTDQTTLIIQKLVTPRDMLFDFTDVAQILDAQMALDEYNAESESFLLQMLSPSSSASMPNHKAQESRQIKNHAKAIRDLAVFARNRGHKILAVLDKLKFGLIVNAPTDYIALGMLYLSLPQPDMNSITISVLKDCLTDQNIQLLRSEWFDWQNDIEEQLTNREMRERPAPKLLAYGLDDYVDALRAKGIPFTGAYTESYIMVAWMKGIDDFEGIVLLDMKNDGGSFGFLQADLLNAKAQMSKSGKPACAIYSPNTSRVKC